MNKKVAVSQMIPSDLSAVAKLHLENLDSPGSKIGWNYLLGLYKLLLSNGEGHILLVAKAGDQIVGVVSGTVDLDKTNRLIKKLLMPKMLFAILFAVILGRLSAFQLFRRYKFEDEIVFRYKKPYPSILALFVDKRFRRHGIGEALVRTLIAVYKKRKIGIVWVNTYISNKSARSFYKALGFRELDRIVDSVVFKKIL